MTMSSSESRSKSKKILDNNGVGQDDGAHTYTGTKPAVDALETFVDEYVDDQMVISSRSIANAVDTEIRVQEIGKTLASHLDGRVGEDFLADVDVSKWSDTQPIKWSFKRVAGEVDRRRSRVLQCPALVREISAATGATGARYRTVEEDGTRWERAKMTVGWMRDVIEAVCETIEYVPAAVVEDDELTRRDWIDKLTQAGTTKVLRRTTGIDDPGADTSWNKSTLRSLHDLLVAERDPSEVCDV